MDFSLGKAGSIAELVRFASPLDDPVSPFSQALKQPLQLGLFWPIQAGGWSALTLPRSTDCGWECNRDLLLKAESLGFDLVCALAQWLPKGGCGGVLDGNALDPFQTTVGLTAITSRISLASTIHVLYGPLPPLHLAQWGTTLDHISGGSWGINVVTGHRAVGHKTFGWNRIAHGRRYELTAEFIEVLQRLWSDGEPFSVQANPAASSRTPSSHPSPSLASCSWSMRPARRRVLRCSIAPSRCRWPAAEFL